MHAGMNGIARVNRLRLRDRSLEKKKLLRWELEAVRALMSRIKMWPMTAFVVAAGLCVLPIVGAAATRVGNDGGTAEEELLSLMQAATSAAREGDQAKLKEIAHRLMIPNYETWFKATFGEEDGAKIAAAYKKNFDWQENGLPKLFEGLAKDQGEWKVQEVKEPDLPAAMPCYQALAKAVKNGAALYQVSLWMTAGSGTRTGRSAGYYAFVDGAYRQLDCVGMGLGISGGVASGGPWTGPIRVGGNVQAARSLYKVPPVYPEEARKKGISGTVRLHVIVAKDGSIKQLEVMSGHALLQQAALDAVRQWRYQPTLLNGSPVEVDTTIDVIFALNYPHARNP
jgi:TonB family protein